MPTLPFPGPDPLPLNRSPGGSWSPRLGEGGAINRLMEQTGSYPLTAPAPVLRPKWQGIDPVWT